MARKVVCLPCGDKIVADTIKYQEFSESINGLARFGMICDSCGKDIKEGEKATALCLFPSAGHPNYESHKPESWMQEYFTFPTNPIIEK